ncbi:hypothetical protein J3Q64DRAFT_1816560 [Phycomyces blakesleeanus]|uniref:Uncharacterized protein n=1 Tax=Phycomyces blakesleeanus TaxID=4837 RepID=A0ABR3BCE1_PHYBL
MTEQVKRRRRKKNQLIYPSIYHTYTNPPTTLYHTHILFIFIFILVFVLILAFLPLLPYSSLLFFFSPLLL